jgi:hypothetical protein
MVQQMNEGVLHRSQVLLRLSVEIAMRKTLIYCNLS